jgi:hypothetical protein
LPASRGPLGYGYWMWTPGSRSMTGARDPFETDGKADTARLRRVP